MNNSMPMIGQVEMFAGNYDMMNWAQTVGQEIPISHYESLYSVIGTSFGGDGRTIFQLPDNAKLNSVDYYINLEASAVTAPTIGQVILWAGQSIPDGWLHCNGAQVSISDYPALYELSYVYGVNKDRTKFHLPQFLDPYTNIRFIIAADESFFPYQNPSSGTLGTIQYRLNGALKYDTNWLTCGEKQQGQELLIAENQELNSILNQTYGGNGTTTFGIPWMPYPGPHMSPVICIKGTFPLRG